VNLTKKPTQVKGGGAGMDAKTAHEPPIYNTVQRGLELAQTLEREHKCKAIESIDCVSIQTLQINGQRGWYWHLFEHMNTLKEKVSCHEIKYCPYCGQEL